jgi:hypothetical protein
MGPPRPERLHGRIAGAPAVVPGWPLGLGRCGYRAPAPAPVHRGDGCHARGRGARQGRPDRGGLERRSVVEQDGCQDLTEVLDAMEPVDDLHGRRRPTAHAVGVEVAAIAADDGEHRLLTQPGRHAGSGAVRQQVHDVRRHHIDQDGARPMAPPPGPRVDADDPQDCAQSLGVTAIRRDEVRQARGEDPAPAGLMGAAECPHGQGDPNGPRPPSQVRQVALGAAMHGRRGPGTAGAGGGWGGHDELAPHRRILNGHIQATDATRGWEERPDQGLNCHGHHLG